jgi:acetyl-CoA carboxylase biotin carboxyl carrier protein
MNEKLRARIRELASILKAEDIDEIELRRWWTTVRVVRRRAGQTAEEDAPVRAVEERAAAAVESAAELEGGARPQTPVGDGSFTPEKVPETAVDCGESSRSAELVSIVSPMVGTFYRAPAPGSEPFVSVGDRVEIGEVLCVIEAMKLMNEIEADRSGVIKKVLVEDNQPVEFGQPLFLVE